MLALMIERAVVTEDFEVVRDYEIVYRVMASGTKPGKRCTFRTSAESKHEAIAELTQRLDEWIGLPVTVKFRTNA